MSITKTTIARFTKHREKAASSLYALLEDIEKTRDQLQETYDERSERWQESEKGDTAQAEISRLEDLLGEVQESLDTLEGIDLGEVDL